MKRPSLDLRLRKAGKTIAEELGVEPPPLIRIARGRLTIRFRQLGASRWSETDRMEHAFEIAATVRAILAAHSRWVLRRRASRAVAVIYQDTMIVNGCDIESRWECVVPVSVDARR